jgi:putative peptidoglycan lipid II flippase
VIAGGRRALGLAAISALARLPGFLIPVLVAATFGAGPSTDAYFLAYGAALLIGGTLAQSVEVAIVPFAVREIAGGTPAAFLARTAGRVTMVGAALWLLVMPVVVVAAPSALRGPMIAYAACFTTLLLCWGASSVYAGALVAHGDIGAATGSLLWRGGGGLLGLALAPVGGGLAGVAVGLGAGELGRLWWLRQQVGRKAAWTAPVTAARLGSFPHAAVAMVIAGAVMGAVPVIEKLIATSLGPGTASHLEYATRLLIVPAVLFDGALAPILLARWSRAVVAEGRVLSLRDVARPLAKGVAVAVVCAAGLAVFASTIVDLLLRHGRFTGADAEAVTVLLRILAAGLVGNMGSLLVERAFLAAGRTRILAVTAFVRGSVRLLTALALLSSLGFVAFGVGYAVAEWVYFLTLVALIRPGADRTGEVAQV